MAYHTCKESTRASKPTEQVHQHRHAQVGWQEFALVAYALDARCERHGLAIVLYEVVRRQRIRLRHATIPISRFRGAKQAGFVVGSRRACLAPTKPAVHAASRSNMLLPSPICHPPRQLEVEVSFGSVFWQLAANTMQMPTSNAVPIALHHIKQRHVLSTDGIQGGTASTGVQCRNKKHGQM